MVLVTGASGFLGQHIVRLLSGKGQEVRAMYHKHPPSCSLASLPGVKWMRSDLLDVFDVEEAMDGVSEVYHCAAVVSFQPADRKRMLHFNIESTANVVNHALTQHIRKLAYISSVAAIGRTGETAKVITEEENWDECSYGSAYGLSKHLAETEVWRGIGEGLNAVILNPGIILGPGNWNEGSAQLMKMADRQFPFYTSGINSWTDVRDVAHAAFLLMNSGITTERFIISAGNYSYKKIFTLMADKLGKKAPSIKAGTLLTGLTWRYYALRSLMTGRKSLVTRETAHTASSISHFANGKLLNALPEFEFHPIEDTISYMADEYLSSQKQNV